MRKRKKNKINKKQNSKLFLLIVIFAIIIGSFLLYQSFPFEKDTVEKITIQKASSGLILKNSEGMGIGHAVEALSIRKPTNETEESFDIKLNVEKGPVKKIAIKELKVEEGYTMSELAFKLKVSKHKISNIFAFLESTEKFAIRKAGMAKIYYWKGKL